MKIEENRAGIYIQKEIPINNRIYQTMKDNNLLVDRNT